MMAILIGASALGLFAAVMVVIGRPQAARVRESEGFRQLRALLDAELGKPTSGAPKTRPHETRPSSAKRKR